MSKTKKLRTKNPEISPAVQPLMTGVVSSAFMVSIRLEIYLWLNSDIVNITIIFSTILLHLTYEHLRNIVSYLPFLQLMTGRVSNYKVPFQLYSCYLPPPVLLSDAPQGTSSLEF